MDLAAATVKAGTSSFMPADCSASAPFKSAAAASRQPRNHQGFRV